MKIHNDILWVMEHQCVNAMLLLDLSAAFDMVDHSVLVNILKNKYGINDVALSWFKNYLQDHRFHVVAEDMISQENNQLLRTSMQSFRTSTFQLLLFHSS